MATSPTVVILGHGTMAARGLQILRSELGVEVPFVVADPADDGNDSWRLSFVKMARSLGFVDGETLFQPKFPHSAPVLAKLKEANPTLILSLQCQKIIRKQVIECSQLGVVNCHNAPLPLLRGCDPFAWAIHDGLKMMGVTLHQVPDEGIDAGPILCQALWPISDDTTAWDLFNQGLDQADELIRKNLLLILEQKLTPRPQEDHLVTYHPMHQFAFRPLAMDWNLPVVTLSAFARARIFVPFQLPTFQLAGQTLHTGKVDVATDVQVTKASPPGTVMALCPLTVAARWGALRVHNLRLEEGFVDTNEELAERLGYKVGDQAS